MVNPRGDKRSGAIAFNGAYHGRTPTTRSLDREEVHPYSAGMGLMPEAMSTARLSRPLRNISDDDAIARRERIFKNDARRKISPPLLMTGTGREGGFYAASPAFMQRLRALCDQRRMLICRRSASGAGRTGAVRHGTDGRCGRYYHVCEIVAGGFSATGRRYRPERA